MVPIKRTREGKQIISCAWIRGIADEGVDPGLVEGEPGGVKVSYDRSRVNKVRVVKLMVIVVLKISTALRRLYG